MQNEKIEDFLCRNNIDREELKKATSIAYDILNNEKVKIIDEEIEIQGDWCDEWYSHTILIDETMVRISELNNKLVTKMSEIDFSREIYLFIVFMYSLSKR